MRKLLDSDSPAHERTADVRSTVKKADDFVPEFPWLRKLTSADLSTTRGFVFQFPPFPALEPATTDLFDAKATAGLYLHIPFCPYRCSYCYYAVEINRSVSEVEQYLDAVAAEVKLVASQPTVSRHVIRTLFFGGGTPTFLNCEEITGAVGLLREAFDLSDLEEFSVESDPTRLTADIAQTLVGLGVNRLSIGVQSFSTEINLLNERKHTEDESLRAIEVARRAGINNLNLDLICGLIGETDESWDYTIDRLLEIQPEHVTIYLFSLRPQTIAWRQVNIGRVPLPPAEDQRIANYLHVRQRLLDSGYTQTTANCFVREPRFEQIHQRNAWSSLPLFGVGNSAYSFVDDCVTQNYRSLKQYSESISRGKLPVEIGHRLNARELMVRYLVLRLKQLSVNRSEFATRFGFEVTDIIGPQIEAWEELDLATLSDEKIELTERGIIYVDDLCRTIYTPNVCERLAYLEGQNSTQLVASLI